MHHLLPDQESAIKLSILSVFCPGKFSRVESNYVATQHGSLGTMPPYVLALHRPPHRAPSRVGLDFILSTCSIERCPPTSSLWTAFSS